MKLKAEKKGIYGFNLEAEVIPPFKEGDTPFVFLKKLSVCFTEHGNLFSVSCESGLYTVRVDNTLSGHFLEVQEMLALFFGVPDILPCDAEVGFSISVADSMSCHLYSALETMLSIAAKTGMAQAGIGPDCYKYPTEIRLIPDSIPFS